MIAKTDRSPGSQNYLSSSSFRFIFSSFCISTENPSQSHFRGTHSSKCHQKCCVCLDGLRMRTMAYKRGKRLKTSGRRTIERKTRADRPSCTFSVGSDQRMWISRCCAENITDSDSTSIHTMSLLTFNRSTKGKTNIVFSFSFTYLYVDCLHKTRCECLPSVNK